MLLFLVTWLRYANPYLLDVFPAMMFITSGKRRSIMILLYCVILTHDMITSLGMRLGFYLYAILQLFLYWRCHLSEFINNQTQSLGKTERILSPTVSFLLSPTG